MSAITTQLTGESLDESNNRALAAGVTAEEFLRHQVEQLLAPPGDGDDFQRAAAYVLHKNAELCRRLA